MKRIVLGHSLSSRCIGRAPTFRALPKTLRGSGEQADALLHESIRGRQP
ncbi:hypothetical protein KTN05_06330 [Paracoccus sp. Z118]|nr:hypothetical protein [Paracoccus sp. Z118]MBV0891471.1 hypothetical protein [Paracoccus sp. Z118]